MGRIVHFVLHFGNRRGVHRPAIVTSSADPRGEIVGLVVFLEAGDGAEDVAGDPVASLFVGAVHFDPCGKCERTWHWPERESSGGSPC